MGNLGRYLGLVACLALLLGGLGVAGAVHYHIKQKVRQVAVLRCIGATLGQVAAVFIIQVMAMALLATLVGIFLGTAIQRLLPLFLADFIPFDLTIQVRPRAMLVATAWGLSMSLLLALAPLIGIRRVSPLLSFRPDPAVIGRDRLALAAYVGVALTWWAFAWAQTGSALRAATFIGALLFCILSLFLTARLLGVLARRLLSPRLPFAWRHGLANLFRPHNQTSVFLIILGMGVFLISILIGSRAMLLGQFEDRSYQERPNFIAFDIQTDQVDGVRETMVANGLPAGEPIPIIPMRLASLKGTPIAELAAKDIPDWSLQREYRSTYRAILQETEQITAGQWIPTSTVGDTPIPVSIEQDIAEILKLTLDDELTVDVLGIVLQLRIASIRKVNWQSMQPNFYLVFPTGVLEQAPGMFLMTSRTEGPASVAKLQRDLVLRYPNVSCVDMTGFVHTLTGVLDRAAAVVRFLAGLCILTGLVMLASAVWSGRYERLGEFALLRTLGATGRQLAQVVLTEYFLLGLFASITGLILAIGANWALARFLFEVAPFPEPEVLLFPVLILPLLTLTLGYLSLRGVWRVAPREVLRAEN
jgi:putative ABC transport system permease protein